MLEMINQFINLIRYYSVEYYDDRCRISISSACYGFSFNIIGWVDELSLSECLIYLYKCSAYGENEFSFICQKHIDSVLQWYMCRNIRDKTVNLFGTKYQDFMHYMEKYVNYANP